MKSVYIELEKWFKDRPKWLQVAASKLINKKEITEEDKENLLKVCKSEVGIGDESDISSFVTKFKELDEEVAVHIQSISDVKNINALSPKNPLEFHDSNLTIIYGQNGAGKSGYTRILKHICGAKNPGTLHKNVFKNTDEKQECTITYRINDKQNSTRWSLDQGSIAGLDHAEVFDTDSVLQYINKEMQVSYEPWIMQLLTELIDVCNYMDTRLSQEIERLNLSKVTLPAKFIGTKPYTWYNEISYKTPLSEINKYCKWDNELQKELDQLRVSLNEDDPVKKSLKIEKEISSLKRLEDSISSVLKDLTRENLEKILDLKEDAKIKRKAANDAAKKVFKEYPLSGIDSATWKALWDKARKYSEEIAYKNVEFPNVSENSLCVLCQQPLGEQAIQRFVSFEEFIKSSLERDARKAEEIFEENINKLIEIPSESEVSTLLDSANIVEKEQVETVQTYFELLHDRKDKFKQVNDIDGLPSNPNYSAVSFITDKKKSLVEQLNSYQEVASTDTRKLMEERLLMLEVTQWLSQQKKSIIGEISTLKKEHKLKRAKKLTRTQSLSLKKSSLSENLITEAYINRFQRELRALGAEHLNLSLNKTRTMKGQILHRVKLTNSRFEGTTSEILSEGEQRIVSLAAFLADVEGRPHNTPFIFDDPISSLDQEFEEATINRLVDLSDKRQVIVFSHRISLITLIKEVAKKRNVKKKTIYLRREMWGTGEPGESPLFAKNMKKALKNLLNNRLSRAKKVLNEEGTSEYEIIVNGICSDFRIIIEKTIEDYLLGDTVKRFRRAINTMGKIYTLSKIEKEDCKLFDELMTKYSRYVHSHSIEAPVQIPYPDELESDFNTLLNWIDEFNQR